MTKAFQNSCLTNRLNGQKIDIRLSLDAVVLLMPDPKHQRVDSAFELEHPIFTLLTMLLGDRVDPSNEHVWPMLGRACLQQ